MKEERRNGDDYGLWGSRILGVVLIKDGVLRIALLVKMGRHS